MKNYFMNVLILRDISFFWRSMPSSIIGSILASFNYCIFLHTKLSSYNLSYYYYSINIFVHNEKFIVIYFTIKSNMHDRWQMMFLSADYACSYNNIMSFMQNLQILRAVHGQDSSVQASAILGHKINSVCLESCDERQISQSCAHFFVLLRNKLIRWTQLIDEIEFRGSTPEVNNK